MYAFLASVFTFPPCSPSSPSSPRRSGRRPWRRCGAAVRLRPVAEAYRNLAAQKEARRRALPRWPIALVDWVDRWKRPIVFASIALTAAAVFFIFRIQVDSHAVKYFGPETEFRQATEYIDEGIIGTNPFEFGFDAGEPGGVYDPAFLKKVERFQQHLLSRPDYQFTHVASIVDVIKRLNQTMHGGDPAHYSIPDRDSVTAEGDTLKARNLIAQYILLYSLSLPQGMELTNQIDIDNRMARVTAFQKSTTSSRQGAVAGEINAWLDKEMPEVGARTLGVPIMFASMMNMAMPGMLGGTGNLPAAHHPAAGASPSAPGRPACSASSPTCGPS